MNTTKFTELLRKYKEAEGVLKDIGKDYMNYKAKFKAAEDEVRNAKLALDSNQDEYFQYLLGKREIKNGDLTVDDDGHMG